MLETLTMETFRPLVGQTFRAYYGPEEGSSIEIRLDEVAPLAVEDYKDHRRNRAPFSLVFRADPSGYLIQGTYEIEHEQLGRLPLFMVPLGPDAQGMRYEIIFT